MGEDDDDPIKKRAAEIRAEEAAASQNETSRAGDLGTERIRFVQQFRDALTDRTSHAVECATVDARPHSAIARFHFFKDGKVWTQNMFEFGIDRIEGDTGSRDFLYYLEPSNAAFAIPNPETGVARPLTNSPAAAVVNYAVAISIEMMARVVASGGALGTFGELDAMVVRQERAEIRKERVARRDKSKKFWTGCGTAILWFFGVIFGIAILGELLRACTPG